MRSRFPFQTSSLRPSEDESASPERGRIYSVSQLNREVRQILESEYPSLWLEAEISNFKNHSSGHMYFSLKDAQSQISAVFFSRHNQSVKFALKDGLEVIVFGRVSVYEPRGQYQFYVERIEPKGVGALQLAFSQLKEKLEKEGLFLPEHKKEIPKYPNRIGIVTSPTGAAIRDMLNVINRRFCGTCVLIYPVRVQGEGAAKEIVRAISDLNQYQDIDVLIVGRGGGSLEDLWAFNEEILARAVFASRIPVISAVGHEIDWTICDLVADLRAPTPSAAAELVVQNSADLLAGIEALRRRLFVSIRNLMASLSENLKTLCGSYAFKQPMVLVQNFEQRLDELVRQLQNYSRSVLAAKKQEFQSHARRLEALSPLAILRRGYSLTRDEKRRLVTDVRKVKPDDVIETKLANGSLLSKVIKIQAGSPEIGA